MVGLGGGHEWFCVCLLYVALGWVKSCLDGWVDSLFEDLVGSELQVHNMLGFCSWKFCCGWGGMGSCMVLCLMFISGCLGLEQKLFGWVC